MLNLPVQLNYFINRQSDKYYNIPLRTINDHELVFILQGTGFIEIEGKTHKTKQNEIYYFTPNLKHRLWVENAPFMKFYALHFTLPNAKEKLSFANTFTPQNPQKIHLLLQELEQVHTTKNYLYEWKENILLENILLELHAQSSETASPTEILRIQKVLDFIHTQPYASFSIEQLAHLAKMKRSSFMLAFRMVTGNSPISYSLNLKISHAQNLLTETQLPILQIAKICGFEDALYFSRTFKKRLGVSPKSYRAKIHTNL